MEVVGDFESILLLVILGDIIPKCDYVVLLFLLSEPGMRRGNRRELNKFSRICIGGGDYLGF